MSFITARHKNLLAGWQTNKRGFARNKNHESDQEYVALLLIYNVWKNITGNIYVKLEYGLKDYLLRLHDEYLLLNILR